MAARYVYLRRRLFLAGICVTPIRNRFRIIHTYTIGI